MKLIEAFTTLSLLAVVATMGWIVAASFAPETVRWATTQIEVILTLVLLAAALLLVSVVALLHTRPRDLP